MSEQSSQQRENSRDISLAGFLLRFAASLLLVIATYNPSGLSFVSWIRNALAASELGSEHFLVGVIILIGWTILVVATVRSLGALGLFLGAAFFAALIWFLIDFGLLAAGSATALAWIILICVAGLLAIGVSWSHIWRKVTGQVEVTDDD